MGNKTNKTNKTRQVLRGALFIALSGTIAAFAWPLTSMYQQSRASEIRGVLRTWCRLGPYPVGHQSLGFEVNGNAMTRGFDYAFKASPEQIKRWQALSPGFKDARRKAQQGRDLFTIKPYQAQRCEVSVDPAKGRVDISASWS